DLTGAWPLEGSSFHAGLPDRAACRAITLHGAAKQVSRQRQRGRSHPERAGKPLVHQGRKRRVEAALEGNPQQNHGSVRVQILLSRFMLRISLPGIKKPDEISPRVFTSMPVLVLPGPVWQSGRVTGKLSQCYSTDITAAL